MTLIWDCAFDNWDLGIGDPGIMGWVIVALYAVTAIAAFVTAGRARFPFYSAKRERIFWFLLGFVLLLLAVNKQMDLQSLLTATGRCMAQIQGWYGERRAVQIGFIVVMLVAVLVLALVLALSLRETLSRNGLALFGLVIVLAFVSSRAAGFHQMDQLINVRISNIRLNWLFEMIGPAMILLCAIINLRPTPR